MKTKFEKVFVRLLKEAADLPTKPNRPMHESDPNAIKDNFLDKDSDPNLLNTEGLPEGVSDAFDKLKTDLKDFSSQISSMKNQLMSDDGNSILGRLATFQNQNGVPASFQSMALDLKRDFKKAYDALNAISSTLLTNGIVADAERQSEMNDRIPTA
jgi:hypothetical protein